MSNQFKKYAGKGETHKGSDSTAPYPVSRLSPVIDLVDLAKEIEAADQIVNVRVSSKLKVVADQIRALQEEARAILDEAKHDQDLHHVRCNFKKIPGQTYHLYQKDTESRYFSMLSPDDWKGNPPHHFLGTFYLEADLSWRSENEDHAPDSTRELVEQLLNTER